MDFKDHVAHIIQLQTFKNYSVYLCNGDRQEARDLIQDVALKALESESMFDGNNLGAWMNTMMYRIKVNQHNYNNRHRVVLIDDPIRVSVGNKLIDFNTAEMEMDLKTRKDILTRAIERLPEKNKTPILLQMEGHSHGEISQIMGMKLTTVESRLRIGKRILKQRL